MNQKEEDREVSIVFSALLRGSQSALGCSINWTRDFQAAVEVYNQILFRERLREAFLLVPSVLSLYLFWFAIVLCNS